MKGTKMSKKVKLKRSNTQKKESNIFDVSPLYFSDFCLTDNKEFAIFYADEKFIIDNDIDRSVILEFKLNENDLIILLDKKVGKFPSEKIPKNQTRIYEWFKSHFPKCVLYPVIEMFDIPVKNMLIVLERDHGKPVGIIKLKQGN